MHTRRAVPDLRTDDLPATRAFYRDFLGFEIGMDLGWVRSVAGMVEVSAGLR